MGNKDRFHADIKALNDGVTGSCNLVVVNLPDANAPNISFIVDCGLFQESEYEKYNEDFPFDAENLDFALVTHNHVDHVGRLPLLVRKGFDSPIYTTEGTKRLLSLSLMDCHKIMKDNCKKKRKAPPYNTDDVGNTLTLVQGCDYGKEIQVHPNVFVTFLTNGHLVGAALIYVRITYPGCDDINLLFTGDYKGENKFLDIEPIPKSILEKPITIIQESTYGMMETQDMIPCFKKKLLKGVEKGSSIIVPVFSLGRSQEILYELKLMQDNGELGKDIPIYLDGKLAIRYTMLYVRDEMNRLGIKESMKNFLPENLTFVFKSTRKSLLFSSECKIVLTTSGMGSYGPAQLYLSHYITQRNALILFTGYTAEGTLGARIKNATYGEEVEIAGKTVTKRARVEYTTEYSAHAKANEMIEFLKQFENIKLVLVNHGEPEVKLVFAERIRQEVQPKDVEVLSRTYFYRVNPYGIVKRFTK